MKTQNRINCAALVLVGVVLGLTSTNACEQNPGKISISVSGAQAGDAQNYYLVQIPEQGTSTVTITGSGQTPCPTDQEKCKCENESADPEKDGDPKYTFSKTVGDQDPTDGPTVKWEVDSSTSPGEYKFKVTKIEQAYKACPQGWTGGVTSKSNTQESDEVTILAYKIETETVATKPQDRKRKKVGVGEEVNLTFKPSSITVNWTVEGNKGSVAPATGTTTKYTAHNEAAEGKVKAEFKGTNKVTSFNVVEPSGVVMERSGNPTTQTAPLGLQYQADVYITPSDVSFEKIKVSEGECAAACTGYFTYQNGLMHAATPSPVGLGQVVENKGTKMQGQDTIGGGTQGPAYSAGTFTWPIPWKYHIGSFSKEFATINHVKELSIVNGKAKLELRKAGSSASISEP